MVMESDIAGRENRDHYKDVPLGDWLDRQQEQKVEEHFEDSKDW